MKKDNVKLYFVALVPGEPVYSRVLDLKKEVCTRFASKAALRSPPHITLHMPFQWPQEKEARLASSLTTLAAEIAVFDVSLQGFGAFPPRVIYVQVEESEPLRALQQAVQKNARSRWHIYPKQDSRPFRPHMTIAFRDLKKPVFAAAWATFASRRFTGTFPANEICLLKHNGKSWDIAHTAPLARIFRENRE